MPVKKTANNKYSVKDKEYDTEHEANKAYMAYLDEAMGVSGTNDDKGKAAKSKNRPAKKKSKK